ncbi:Uncharacterized protein conserved in bacteria [Serratia rubidaea]|uniref:Uncharacterized protein conserved in bacteria n=1 Tax=Serratia rubidaea TaxID=61652 RepID=A0A4V6YXU9_SERRU|nr:Uncharacterized protein conserved in bacteria [Serratia rubidaea]
MKSSFAPRLWGFSLLMLGALLLSGCMSSAKSVPSRYGLTFDAAPQVNANAGQSPAPIKVRVLLLRSDAEFMDADFFSLQNDAKSVLGNSLQDSDQFFLTPGQTGKKAERSEHAGDALYRGDRRIPEPGRQSLAHFTADACPDRNQFL